MKTKVASGDEMLLSPDIKLYGTNFKRALARPARVKYRDVFDKFIPKFRKLLL
ncbi:hypothetical protein GCM10007105_38830 [Shewanella chilikensis]|nr:hypothetical protein GCM10007105_38830 [Shewanella chilikensis]